MPFTKIGDDLVQELTTAVGATLADLGDLNKGLCRRIEVMLVEEHKNRHKPSRVST